VEELHATHGAGWPDDIRRRIADELVQFLEATWKEFFNPEVYKDAGLPDAYALRREVLADESVAARRSALCTGCARTLLKAGLLSEECIQ